MEDSTSQTHCNAGGSSTNNSKEIPIRRRLPLKTKEFIRESRRRDEN